MGNLISNMKNDNNDTTTKKPATIREIMDYVASYYILTMDFNSLRKLHDKEYCDKLVILTSEIVDKYFTNMEITYLAQSIESGDSVQSEKKDNENAGELQKDRISFFNKNELSKLDIQNPIKKKRVCNGISKFYVKIAHIFATILTTINPVYVYKDESGNTVNANIYNKNKIPKGVKHEIRYLNICDTRINALKRDLDLDSVGEVNIHPNICSFNIAKPEETLNYQKHMGGATVELTINNSNGATVESDNSELKKTLEDEPGIPELMELYYDDMYNYETGKFTGMSDSSRELFEENLKYFYSVFTDGKEMPEHIKKFSDIKLREYHNMIECKGEKPLLDTVVKGNFNDELFKKYAENLKGMIKKAKENQDLLLDVLNKLFSYTVDKETNKKQIRINPKLTESNLQEVVLETRAIIVRLYLTCETDFTNGIKIYEAIVERTILETTKNQLKTLEKMADKLVAESEIPNPAETKELERIKGLNV
jgi:hypothetical protein